MTNKKPRKEILHVLVEGEDKKRIVGEAEKARLSASSFCRVAILRYLKYLKEAAQ